MSLSSTLRLASNALNAAQIGLQVAGQNISNANTPGYIREEVVLAPAPTQRYGGILLGLGVHVSAVIQKVDRFVEDRLRGAISERVGSEIQQEAYRQVESILGELSDTDLSTSLNRFFSSIAEVANQPENTANRNLATQNGQILAGDFNRMSDRARGLRRDYDEQVRALGDDINRLTEEIRRLNIRIAELEGGDTSRSDAVGLRDARNAALQSLSEITDIRVEELPSGGVAVYAGSNYLVYEGISRHVQVTLTDDSGEALAGIEIVETGSQLESAHGRLAGLRSARDDVLGGFLDGLDNLASALIQEFNRVFTSGQGLTGFQELSSESGVSDVNEPLDQAGLTFIPESGSFEVLVYDEQTGLHSTHRIDVNLNGLDTDTTLASLAGKLDAIQGVFAEIGHNRELVLRSESDVQSFAFANDSSGVLAALGLNTFFSGTGASDIGVRQFVREDPTKFAASRGGVAQDEEIALELSAFMDRRLAGQNKASLAEIHDAFVSRITQDSSVTRAVTEGLMTFEETLRAQSLAVSGVNLDEEAVRLMTFQRMFQASARVITTISELLDTLVNI